MSEEKEMKTGDLQEFLEMCGEAPWYRRWFNLPVWTHNKLMRTFTFQLWDCSVTHKSLTKLHRFDVLICNHRKWWQPKYMGFTIWFC